jgi:protease I
MPHRRVLFIIAPERFRDEELAQPRAALVAAGHTVDVASTRAGALRGMLGARETVTRTLAGESGSAYDALVIVGGSGAPDHLWNSEALRAMVRAMRGAQKTLAAICLAPPVFARAGILMGVRATVFPAPRAKLELKRGGAIIVEEPVVQDGAIVTANGPEAAAAFGATLAKLLGP